MDRNQKKLLIIDSVVVIGSLLTLFFLVGYTQPLVIAPFSDGSTASDVSVRTVQNAVIPSLY